MRPSKELMLASFVCLHVRACVCRAAGLFKLALPSTPTRQNRPGQSLTASVAPSPSDSGSHLKALHPPQPQQGPGDYTQRRPARPPNMDFLLVALPILPAYF